MSQQGDSEGEMEGEESQQTEAQMVSEGGDFMLSATSHLDLWCVLQQQYQDGFLCDVILKVEQVEIPVHRCILSAASPYFNAMFRGAYRETQQAEVELQNIAGATLREIVNFMYGIEVPITKHNVADLLQGADMLQVTELTYQCVRFLLENLSVANSLWTWSIADFHSLEEIIPICKYIATYAMPEHFLNDKIYDEVYDLQEDYMLKFFKDGVANYMSIEALEFFIQKYIDHDSESRKITFEQYMDAANEAYRKEFPDENNEGDDQPAGDGKGDQGDTVEMVNTGTCTEIDSPENQNQPAGLSDAQNTSSKNIETEETTAENASEAQQEKADGTNGCETEDVNTTENGLPSAGNSSQSQVCPQHASNVENVVAEDSPDEAGTSKSCQIGESINNEGDHEHNKKYDVNINNLPNGENQMDHNGAGLVDEGIQPENGQLASKDSKAGEGPSQGCKETNSVHSSTETERKNKTSAAETKIKGDKRENGDVDADKTNDHGDPTSDDVQMEEHGPPASEHDGSGDSAQSQSQGCSLHARQYYIWSFDKTPRILLLFSFFTGDWYFYILPDDPVYNQSHPAVFGAGQNEDMFVFCSDLSENEGIMHSVLTGETKRVPMVTLEYDTTVYERAWFKQKLFCINGALYAVCNLGLTDLHPNTLSNQYPDDCGTHNVYLAKLDETARVWRKLQDVRKWNWFDLHIKIKPIRVEDKTFVLLGDSQKLYVYEFNPSTESLDFNSEFVMPDEDGRPVRFTMFLTKTYENCIHIINRSTHYKFDTRDRTLREMEDISKHKPEPADFDMKTVSRCVAQTSDHVGYFMASKLLKVNFLLRYNINTKEGVPSYPLFGMMGLMLENERMMEITVPEPGNIPIYPMSMWMDKDALHPVEVKRALREYLERVKLFENVPLEKKMKEKYYKEVDYECLEKTLDSFYRK